MKALDTYYNGLNEPLQGFMLAIRQIILSLDDQVEETWKWSAPFFLYRKHMLCYLWMDKKTHEPYLGIYGGDALDHPALVQKHNARIKKLVFDIEEDIPIKTIQEVLLASIGLIAQKR